MVHLYSALSLMSQRRFTMINLPPADRKHIQAQIAAASKQSMHAGTHWWYKYELLAMERLPTCHVTFLPLLSKLLTSCVLLHTPHKMLVRYCKHLTFFICKMFAGMRAQDYILWHFSLNPLMIYLQVVYSRTHTIMTCDITSLFWS